MENVKREVWSGKLIKDNKEFAKQLEKRTKQFAIRIIKLASCLLV
jgi:hypothetical protein